MQKQKIVTFCEIAGSILAVAYTILIASNTDSETIAFSLLLIGTIPFGVWALIDRKWAFLVLQIFYAGSAVFGFIRWNS